MRFKTFRRWWSSWKQSGTGGLIHHGDWRCRYPDGKVTYYMSYGDAENCRIIDTISSGKVGTLEWRYDNIEAKIDGGKDD